SFLFRVFSVLASFPTRRSSDLVLVNFWGAWCVPCRDEAPTLKRAWKAYRDRGVMLVGVDVWDNDQDASVFLREFAISYPNGPDLDRKSTRLNSSHQISSYAVFC